MTQSPLSSVKSTQKPKFVSCIRIDGVPILPPLITAEKRKELRRHKRDAVKVEKRLKREKELKEYVSQLYQTCTSNFDDTYGNINNMCTKESQTKASKDTTHLVVENNINLLSIQSNINQSVVDDDIDQTIHCNGNKLFIIGDYDDNTEAAAVLNNFVEDQKNTISECLEGFDQGKVATPPKLIRCNSYTLDAPSPALVAYLKTSQSDLNPTTCWELDISLRQPSQTPRSEFKDDADQFSHFVESPAIVTCLNDCNQEEEAECNATFTKSASILNDLQITSLDETPRIENLQIVEQFVREDYMSKLSILEDFNDNELNSSRTETELRNLSDCESQLQDFITNNIPHNNVTEDKNEGHRENHPESVLNENLWDSILKQIPSTYSRQILELLDRQQSAQNESHATHDISEAFQDIQCNPEKYSTPCDTTLTSQSTDTVYSIVDPEISKSLKAATSQLTFYEDAQSDNSAKVSFIEAEEVEKETEEMLRLELESWKKEVDVSDFSIEVQPEVVAKDDRKLKCGKRLNKDEAANILTAAARGFLIRRLMKTEKVQYLIQTIKEAVLCAMQLHHDTLDHIEEADVELHRRLIQQVSAACDSFHNVFFATSIQDQMSFIAVDRQKKHDKLRRISSASSNISIRSNKSTRSLRSSSRKKLLRS